MRLDNKSQYLFFVYSFSDLEVTLVSTVRSSRVHHRTGTVTSVQLTDLLFIQAWCQEMVCPKPIPALQARSLQMDKSKPVQLLSGPVSDSSMKDIENGHSRGPLYKFSNSSQVDQSFTPQFESSDMCSAELESLELMGTLWVPNM